MVSRRPHVVRETAPGYSTASPTGQEPLAKADAKAIERGRRAIAAGEFVTPDDLRDEVARPRRVTRRKSARARSHR